MTDRYSHLPTLTFAAPAALLAAAAGSERIYIAPINVPSDDDRVVVDGLGWRSNVPILFSDSEDGHRDARHVANAEDLAIVSVGAEQWVVGRPVWDDDDLAREAHRLVVEQRLNGISMHLGKGRFAEVCPTGSGSYREISFPEDYVPVERDGVLVDLEAPCERPLFGAFDAEIAALTIVAIPAFAESRIVVEEPVAAAPIVEVVAAAAGMPVSLDRPPADWFSPPVLDGPTALRVDEDGRVYGHLLVWDTCHTGFQGRCVKPAPGETDYSLFLTARVIAEDGARIAVGPLVVDDGHASPLWSIERLTAYYSDTRLATAYVNVGEDDYGVWVAGAVAERANARQVETLRRHALSGDWRRIDGKFSLVAVVSVNAPGFPVPEVLVAAGVDVGLITYGPEPERDEPSDLELIALGMERFHQTLADIRALLTTTRPNTIVNNHVEPAPGGIRFDSTHAIDDAEALAAEVETVLLDGMLDQVLADG